VEDADFRRDLGLIREEALRDKLLDNVYGEEYVDDGRYHRKKKVVNRRTQTYISHLLHSPEKVFEDSDPEI
jgi:hypothetical protein